MSVSYVIRLFDFHIKILSDETEQSHVPTADQVSRVFTAGNIPVLDEDEDEEEIEEVDFNDVGKLFDTTATTTPIRKSKLAETTTIMEQRFTGSYVEPNIRNSTDVDGLAKMVEDTLSTTDDVESTPLFFVDTQPTPVPMALAPPANAQPLAPFDDDDDIIVYVAPHPRKSSSKDVEAPTLGSSSEAHDASHFTPYVRATPLPSQSLASTSTNAVVEAPSLASVSFSFSKSGNAASGSSTPSRLRVPPVSTPRQAKLWKRKRNLAGKRAKSSFGAFGAMREEALLRKRDPRKAERRQNGSDLDWGDTDDEDVQEAQEELDPQMRKLLNMLDKGKGKAKQEEGPEDEHGMDVDSELDLGAMRSFVGGLLGSGAGTHTTMDDLKDEEVMRMEDENAESEERGSSESDAEEEDVEAVVTAEEVLLISESLQFEDEDGLDDEDDDDEDEDDDDEDDDGDDQTPRTSFQARLERLREKARSRKAEDASFDDYMDDSDEGDEEDLLTRNMTWAEKDDDYIQHIHVSRPFY